MSVNNFINDASIAFGGPDITISAVVYPTEDFKLDRPVNRFLSKTSKGLPRGKVVTRGEQAGSFTCILPTATAVMPQMGDAFTVTYDTVALACHIESVGRAENNSGETKIPCTFSVDIGTVVVT